MVSAVWTVFHLKRLHDGSKRSNCGLKKEDGKDCDYVLHQKEKDCSTSTLIKHIRNKHPKDYKKVFGETIVLVSFFCLFVCF